MAAARDSISMRPRYTKRAAFTCGDSMIVDRSGSYVRPFGTGISSNSLRTGRGGVLAHATKRSAITTTAETRRKFGMQHRSSAPRTPPNLNGIADEAGYVMYRLSRSEPQSRSATASPWRYERRGIWGDPSRSPMSIDRAAERRGLGGPG